MTDAQLWFETMRERWDGARRRAAAIWDTAAMLYWDIALKALHDMRDEWGRTH